MEPGTFKFTTVKKKLETRLYLHMENKGYADVANPNKSPYFGLLRVNDWPLYDNLGPNKKLIGRARGTHIQSGVDGTIWQYHLSVMFVDDRFKGSSLQATGNDLISGEWAIVGGTGEFTGAQGNIYKKKVQSLPNDETIMEVTVRAFYTPLEKPST